MFLILCIPTTGRILLFFFFPYSCIGGHCPTYTPLSPYQTIQMAYSGRKAGMCQPHTVPGRKEEPPAEEKKIPKLLF